MSPFGSAAKHEFPGGRAKGSFRFPGSLATEILGSPSVREPAAVGCWGGLAQLSVFPPTVQIQTRLMFTQFLPGPQCCAGDFQAHSPVWCVCVVTPCDGRGNGRNDGTPFCQAALPQTVAFKSKPRFPTPSSLSQTTAEAIRDSQKSGFRVVGVELREGWYIPK